MRLASHPISALVHHHGLVRFCSPSNGLGGEASPSVEDVYAEIAKISIDSLAEAPLKTDMSMRHLCEVKIAEISTSPYKTSRTRQQVADGNDDFMLTILLDGEIVGHQERCEEVTIRAGEAYLWLNENASTVAAPEGAAFLNIAIPRSRLAPQLIDLDGALKGSISPTPVTRLLTAYATTLAREEERIAPRDAQLLSTQITDLASLVLGARRENSALAGRRGGRAARLAAIKADMVANVGNPDLSLDWLAKRHHVSARVIRNLFYAEGSGILDHLLNLRLDRACALLSDRSNARHNIAAIALMAGFGDISWFSRTFQRRFGMTPSDVRAETLSRQAQRG
jgi:AraC-like DNA-binding protein